MSRRRRGKDDTPSDSDSPAEEKRSFTPPATKVVKASFWAEWFGLDKRAIAMFRVLMGWTCFLDVWWRSADVDIFYTDDGLVPRDIVLQNWVPPWVCIYMMSGYWKVIAGIMILHAIIALCVLVGYKTKYTLPLLWFFHTSIQIRNHFIGHGGDTYIRVCLFFAMFLPTADVWSVDASLSDTCEGESESESESEDTNSRSGNKSTGDYTAPALPASYQHLSAATFAVLVQIWIMYYFSYKHKLMEGEHVWLVAQDATYYAMRIDYFRTFFGDLFLSLPLPVLKLFSLFTMFIEGPFSFLILSPILPQYCRLATWFMYSCLHIGFGLNMRLDIFTWCTLTGASFLCPRIVFDFFTRRLDTQARRESVLRFNTAVPAYNTIGRLAAGMLLTRYTKVEGVFEPNSKLTVEVVGAKDKKHTGADALIALCSLSWSPCAWICGFIFRLTRSLTAWTLTTTATHLLNTTPLNTPPPTRDSSVCKLSPTLSVWVGRVKWVVVEVFVLVCIVICVFYAASVVEEPWGINDDYRWIAMATQLEQGWGMFSHPPILQWDYTIEGVFENGRRVDFFKNNGMKTLVGEEMSGWGFPKRKRPIHLDYGSHRWFKYWENFNTHEMYPLMRKSFATYMCLKVNELASGPDEYLHTIAVHYHQEIFLENFESRKGLNILLLEHYCLFDGHDTRGTTHRFGDEERPSAYPSVPGPVKPVLRFERDAHEAEMRANGETPPERPPPWDLYPDPIQMLDNPEMAEEWFGLPPPEILAEREAGGAPPYVPPEQRPLPPYEKPVYDASTTEFIEAPGPDGYTAESFRPLDPREEDYNPMRALYTKKGDEPNNNGGFGGGGFNMPAEGKPPTAAHIFSGQRPPPEGLGKADEGGWGT